MRPILEHIADVAQKVYQPTKELSVDESLVKFHGRWQHKQYISSKHAKWGIKFFCLCEPKSGYLLNWKCFAGSEKYPGLCQGTGVVLDLVNYLGTGSGHEIYTDNYYTSPELALKLAERGIHLTSHNHKPTDFIYKVLD